MSHCLDVENVSEIQFEYSSGKHIWISSVVQHDKHYITIRQRCVIFHRTTKYTEEDLLTKACFLWASCRMIGWVCISRQPAVRSQCPGREGDQGWNAVPLPSSRSRVQQGALHRARKPAPLEISFFTATAYFPRCLLSLVPTNLQVGQQGTCRKQSCSAYSHSLNFIVCLLYRSYLNLGTFPLFSVWMGIKSKSSSA